MNQPYRRRSFFSLMTKLAGTLTFAGLSILPLAGLAAGQDITIGAALPMSGDVSYYGQDSRRGIDLALDEINAKGGAGGHHLRVIYEDTQGQGTLAVSAIRALLDVEHVPAVIGGGTSTETLAMAPIAQREGHVLLSPVSSASQISRAGDFVFRSVPSDGAQAADLAHWVIKKGYKRIALIYVNQSWGVGLKTDFVSQYQSLGGQILATESSDQGEVDFRTQLVSMRASNPQAYVAIVYAREGGLLLRQARELGVLNQFFGADPWTKKEFADSSGPAGNGVLFTTPAVYSGPEFDVFAKLYRARYHQDPGIYEAHGYDCMMLLARAIQKAGTSPRALRDALASTHNYMGATGNTTFDKNGDVPTKGFARMTWTNGTLAPAKQ
jgi:branched-chain amino acid transport system substrate-binding protein